jgi:hypothetical protein
MVNQRERLLPLATPLPLLAGCFIRRNRLQLLASRTGSPFGTPSQQMLTVSPAKQRAMYVQHRLSHFVVLSSLVILYHHICHILSFLGMLSLTLPLATVTVPRDAPLPRLQLRRSMRVLPSALTMARLANVRTTPSPTRCEETGDCLHMYPNVLTHVSERL